MTQNRLKGGEIVGNFQVLHLVAGARRRAGAGAHRRWLVICRPCGKILEKNTNDIRKQESCGCLWSHRERRIAIASVMYSHLKKRHKKYSDEIIPFERFLYLSERDCRYCGSPPSNTAKDASSSEAWRYSGLDRINSQFGYIEGNIQPCCKRCNVAKSDMDEADFLSHILKIAETAGYLT